MTTVVRIEIQRQDASDNLFEEFAIFEKSIIPLRSSLQIGLHHSKYNLRYNEIRVIDLSLYIYRMVPVLMVLVSYACFEYHEIQCALSIRPGYLRDITLLKVQWLHQSLTDIKAEVRCCTSGQLCHRHN